MSKTKGQTFRYRFENETETFWYRSRICLVENRLFRFGPESALLEQIDMISFDGVDSLTNSDVLVPFMLDVETFVARLSFTVLTLLVGGDVKIWMYKWLETQHIVLSTLYLALQCNVNIRAFKNQILIN